VSPFQNQSFTYEELQQTSDSLAGFLQLYGFERRDLLISDLPNTTENAILQLACNRLGVYFGTVKNAEQLVQFPRVKGAVSVDSTGFLAETTLPLPCLSGEFLVDLIRGGNTGGVKREVYSMEHFDQEALEDATITPHAYYNSTSNAFTNGQALQLADEAANELFVVEQDVVCISVTLCHPFGMGSAIGSCLLRGACIALPAVGGIYGCGVPSERAAATFEVLESEKCTLLFADTHTLQALPDHPERLNLRGGVCKIGSGSDWLNDTRKYAGVTLRTMGSKE
jgi:acyl-CoA synthetase (AMP-forming)/AMP-acid ligase II